MHAINKTNAFFTILMSAKHVANEANSEVMLPRLTPREGKDVNHIIHASCFSPITLLFVVLVQAAQVCLCCHKLKGHAFYMSLNPFPSGWWSKRKVVSHNPLECRGMENTCRQEGMLPSQGGWWRPLKQHLHRELLTASCSAATRGGGGSFSPAHELKPLTPG